MDYFQIIIDYYSKLLLTNNESNSILYGKDLSCLSKDRWSSQKASHIHRHMIGSVPMRDSFPTFWLIFPVLPLAAAGTGAFFSARIRHTRARRSARQLFYQACRKHAIAESADLSSAEHYEIAVRLAGEYGLSCPSREVLGRILDEEKPSYEARRRTAPH